MLPILIGLPLGFVFGVLVELAIRHEVSRQLDRKMDALVSSVLTMQKQIINKKK